MREIRSSVTSGRTPEAVMTFSSTAMVRTVRIVGVLASRSDDSRGVKLLDVIVGVPENLVQDLVGVLAERGRPPRYRQLVADDLDRQWHQVGSVVLGRQPREPVLELRIVEDGLSVVHGTDRCVHRDAEL